MDELDRGRCADRLPAGVGPSAEQDQQRPPLSTFFSLWFDRIVPLIGTVAGDRDAYSYLPESVKRFPPPDGLAALMDGAGLEGIRWTILAGGIIAIHSGTRPEGGSAS